MARFRQTQARPWRVPTGEQSLQSEYRIIGAELSPFSVKVRSYFRFKDISHQWTVRSLEVRAAAVWRVLPHTGHSAGYNAGRPEHAGFNPNYGGAGVAISRDGG